jgi:predicted RND superfamily exporter protein
MQHSIGFGAERIAVAVLAFPRIAALCLLGLLMVIVASLPRLSFDEDIHRAFLSDSALSQAQRAYDAAQPQPRATVLVHVTSPAALTAAQMGGLRDLALDLEFAEGVMAVASPFALRWPPDAQMPSGAPLFGPRIGPDFGDALARFAASGTGLPTFVNAARTGLLMTVAIDTDQTTVAAATAEIAQQLASSLPSDLTAHLTGEEVISAEIVAGLKDDLIELNLWGALIVAAAALVLLRDLRMALLAVVPAMAGACGVLALSVWLGYPVTVLSNVIPMLLLVLGVADGVHLAGSFKLSGNLRETVLAIGPACALTSLTTAVAFCSIMLTGNPQLFEFAVLGALGTVLSFYIVLVTFTLSARHLTLSQRPVPGVTATVAQRIARAGGAAPRVTITGCVVVLVLAAVGFSQTRAWFPLYQNLPGDSATPAANDAIARDFGGVFQMIVETDSDWQTTRDLVERLEAVSIPGAVLSEVNPARWLGTPEVRPTQDDLTALPGALKDTLRGADGVSRIFVSMPEPMRSAQTLAAFDAVHDLALASGATRVLGLPAVMRIEAVALIRQLSVGLLVAALGATVLVAVAFRSLRLVPVLLIPNLLPLMLTGASLHLWAQGFLTPTAVLALTIAFGIAIDDTVHFLSSFRALTAQGLTPHRAVAGAARSTGQVIVLTTVLLTCGLCVTLWSDFTPVRVFGAMMISTLWAALLTDLLLLPALLTWRKTPDARD